MDMSQAQLRNMINQMVEQAVGEKLGSRAASWQADRQSNYARLSYDRQSRSLESQGFNFYGFGKAISGIDSTLEKQHHLGMSPAEIEGEKTKKI